MPTDFVVAVDRAEGDCRVSAVPDAQRAVQSELKLNQNGKVCSRCRIRLWRRLADVAAARGCGWRCCRVEGHVMTPLARSWCRLTQYMRRETGKQQMKYDVTAVLSLLVE